MYQIDLCRALGVQGAALAAEGERDRPVGTSNEKRRLFLERFGHLVVQDAPQGAIDGAIGSFGRETRRSSAIERLVGLLKPNLGPNPGLAGMRTVAVAGRDDLLYEAGPHALVLSLFHDDAGWRLLGQLLVAPGFPAPTLVEVAVASQRTATHIDPETGEFGFENLCSGSASLVFIGVDVEVTVDSIELEPKE